MHRPKACGPPLTRGGRHDTDVYLSKRCQMRGEPLRVQQDDQAYVLCSVLPPGGLLEHIRDTVLDVKPKHISHGQKSIRPRYLCSVLPFPKKQKPQNSEADILIIGATASLLERKHHRLENRYVSGRSIENRPNRPHISSSSNHVKQHQDKKSQQMHPKSRRSPRSPASKSSAKQTETHPRFHSSHSQQRSRRR